MRKGFALIEGIIALMIITSMAISSSFFAAQLSQHQQKTQTLIAQREAAVNLFENILNETVVNHPDLSIESIENDLKKYSFPLSEHQKLVLIR